MFSELLPILEDERDAADAAAQRYVVQHNVQLACKEGCDFCCYLRVDAFHHEAVAIADHIRRHFTLEEREALMIRLQEHVAFVGCLSVEQHHRTNVRCPLLIESRCSVYPVRPFACRGYTSLDVGSCEKTFRDPLDTTEQRLFDEGLTIHWLDAFDHQAEAALRYGHPMARELGTLLLAVLAESG